MNIPKRIDKEIFNNPNTWCVKGENSTTTDVLLTVTRNAPRPDITSKAILFSSNTKELIPGGSKNIAKATVIGIVRGYTLLKKDKVSHL